MARWADIVENEMDFLDLKMLSPVKNEKGEVIDETFVYHDGVVETRVEPKIDYESLHKNLKEKLSKLTLRRVSRVDAHNRFWLQTKIFLPAGETVGDFKEECKVMSYDAKIEPDSIERVTEYNYSHYWGTTTDYYRENVSDPCPGQTILFSNDTKHSFDIVDGSFSFNPNCDKTVPPRKGNKAGESDCICGEVKCIDGKYIYTKWFIASEQFLRMWSAVMFGKNYTSLMKLCKNKPETLRDKIFSGNYVCSNSFRKWLLAHEQQGLPVDPVQYEKRYYRLRTELVNNPYVHTYAAIVLMCLYHELPNENNVPCSKDTPQAPGIKKWDLPEGFVQKLISLV